MCSAFRRPGGHSFATGGSNAAEHWFNASYIGDSLMATRWGVYRNIGARTEESCTQYNTLKVAHHLFLWGADGRLADYHERALLNGLLGNQNVSNGMTVALEYFLPLGGAPGPYEPTGIYKPWAGVDPHTRFPCCWGTLAESYAKLADSIYFHSPDNTTIFINLFESSSVRWDGLILSQQAAFPIHPTHTTTITIKSVEQRPDASRTIALRVPFWATSGENAVTVNGEPVEASKLVPSKYVLLTRAWATGDTVVVAYPLSLRFEQLDDQRTAFAGFGTFFYGPLLLAGLTTNATLLLGNRTLNQTLRRNSTKTLEFEATSAAVCGGEARTVAMVPFNTLRGAHSRSLYQVYFHTRAWSGHTTPTGTPVVTFASASDFVLKGGASVLPNMAVEQLDDLHEQHRHTDEHEHITHAALENPNHRHYAPPATGAGDYDATTGNHYGAEAPSMPWASLGALNLRSGAPRGHSVATMALPFKGAATISSIDFEYRYIIGYGIVANSTGARLSFEFLHDLDCPASGHSTLLYSSQRYLLPSWDKCHECYSDPIKVSVAGLNLSTAEGGSFAFKFDNGDHNMQLLLPIDVRVGWR